MARQVGKFQNKHQTPRDKRKQPLKRQCSNPSSQIEKNIPNSFTLFCYTTAP